MDNPLREALTAAALELENAYGWAFGLDGLPTADGESVDPFFLEVFERHLEPLLVDWKEHRIAALQAELSILDGDHEA